MSAFPFLHYTQAQLDHNYNQAEWAPNWQQLMSRYAWRSQLARTRLGAPVRLTYGEGPLHGVDVFRAGAPLMVFVHGGGWREGRADSYHFPAPMFVDRGITFAALDFEMVQDVGLDGMIEQVRQGFAAVVRQASRLGADPNRVYVSGHSSGAHLAAVLLTTRWADYGLPDNVVKGATLISGMYDLKPVRLSARSTYVPFTDDIEHDLSPQRHLQCLNMPLLLGYGELETDEFKRQTQDFAAALQAAGKPAQLLYQPHVNHFEILDDFANPYGPIASETLKMVLG